MTYSIPELVTSNTDPSNVNLPIYTQPTTHTDSYSHDNYTHNSSNYDNNNNNDNASSTTNSYNTMQSSTSNIIQPEYECFDCTEPNTEIYRYDGDIITVQTHSAPHAGGTESRWILHQDSNNNNHQHHQQHQSQQQSHTDTHIHNHNNNGNSNNILTTTQTIDAPVSFGGTANGPSPLNTFLISASASQQLTMNIVLATDPQLKTVQIHSIRWIAVHAKMNSELMETGNDNRSVISSSNSTNNDIVHNTWSEIRFVAELEGNATQWQFEHLVSQVEQRCPVTQLLIRAGTNVYNDWYLKAYRSPVAVRRTMQSPQTSRRNSFDGNSHNTSNSNNSGSQYDRVFSVTGSNHNRTGHNRDSNDWLADGFLVHVDATPVLNNNNATATPLTTFLISVASCMQVTAQCIIHTDERLKGKHIDLIEWTDVNGSYNAGALLHGQTSQHNNTLQSVTLRADIQSSTMNQDDCDYMVQQISRRCPQSIMLARAGCYVDCKWTLVDSIQHDSMINM